MLQNETFRRNFKHSVDFRRDDGDDEDNQTRFLRISINGTKNLSHRSCPSINRKSNISDFSHICFEPKAAQQASVSFIFRFYALRALESAPFVRFGPSSFEATWDARWWAMQQGSETRARASNFCEWLLLCRPARSSRRTTRFSRQPTHIWPKIHIWPPKAKILPNHGLWHISAFGNEWQVWNQWKWQNIKCMTHQQQ